MLTRFIANDFGCIRGIDIQLTPLHAFIGPNDSGKSTLLQAVRTLSQFATGSFGSVNGPGSRPFDPRLPSPNAGPKRPWLVGQTAKGSAYRLDWITEADHPFLEKLEGAADRFESFRSPMQRSALHDHPHLRGHLLELGPCALVRFDADRLRQRSQLEAFDVAIAKFFQERGLGLSGLLMALLARGDDSFAALRAAFLEKFPTCKRVGVRAVSQQEIVLETELHDGTVIDASQMSEGMLFYLGYAILEYIGSYRVLLVEEPENGLHPSRIADVMRILRGLAEGRNPAQVLIATHSPLVVNELQPNEVSIVTRTKETGTMVTPIQNTKYFKDRSEVYALGELWLSYADGVLEQELVPSAGGVAE